MEMAAMWGGSIVFTALCFVMTTLGQQSKQVEYTMYEETPSNSYIGEIKEDANLKSEFTPEVLTTLRYAILVQSSQYAEFFAIDEVESTLRTAKPLDRETICPQMEQCSINFDIALQPREHFQIIKVTIKVEDINDNPPNFIDSHISRSVPENTAPGARFTLPAADDPDSPKYGVKRYEMITGAPQFALNVSGPAAGATDLQLILREELDREARELYTVVIACYDGGLAPKSGFLTVDVIVLDVNDNYPKFDNDTYQVTVPENVSQNSVIIKLRARDPDALSNGQVVYSFTSKTQVAFGDKFGINNITGEIFVRDKLDYEENTIYNLAVIAHDKTPEALTGRTKVVIKVQDVNDHAPEITISALTDTGHVEIPERAPVDIFVAHIAVADPDSGVNGELTCSMDSLFFDIKPLGETTTEYKVVTTKPLDRETQAFHQVIFICKDRGLPSLTSTASILVNVLDENDHEPVFTKSVYSAIVAENNSPGSFVLRVHAEDADSGENAMLDYSLDTDAGGYLAVDPVSGNITARLSFDYEDKSQLEFVVIATDHGKPPQSSSALVKITVTDTNDNSPEFLQDHYVFDVYENLPLGTEVGQVSATDVDSPPYDSFMYFMDPGASATDTFVVEPQTGRIFTRQTLDRETRSQYQLVVMAVSQEAPSMQSSVKVVVHVADKNDNGPVLLFPNPHNDTIHVKSNAPLGATVAQIVAQDLDIGINSRLTYRLLDGNEDGFFIMDEQSGMLAVREPLGALDDKLFIMKVQVLDGGDPQNSNEAFLNIVVNKSVEHAPIIASSNLTIVVAVAVVSGIIAVVLIVAIIRTERYSRCCRRRNKYVHQKVHQPNVLVLDGSNKNREVKVNVADDSTVEPGDNNLNNKKEVTFSHDIDLEDERPPTRYSSNTDTTTLSVANNKAPVHYDPRGSTYVSLYNAAPASSHNLPQSTRQPPQGRPQGQAQGQYKSQTGQTGQPELASTSFDRELKDIATVGPKDRDSDSTNSAASNADSGRGSNEDTDSRPSMNDSVTHHPDGVILVPPLQHKPHNQSESFKVRLSSVVKMQHDHVHDKLVGPVAGSDKPPVPKRQLSNGRKSHRREAKPNVPAKQPPPRPGTVNEPLPRRSLQPQVPSKLPASGQLCSGTTAASHPTNHRDLLSTGLQGNDSKNTRYSGNRTSEDDTESEWSDEDKEYVYYVNASHV